MHIHTHVVLVRNQDAYAAGSWIIIVIKIISCTIIIIISSSSSSSSGSITSCISFFFLLLLSYSDKSGRLRGRQLEVRQAAPVEGLGRGERAGDRDKIHIYIYIYV